MLAARRCVGLSELPVLSEVLRRTLATSSKSGSGRRVPRQAGGAAAAAARQQKAAPPAGEGQQDQLVAAKEEWKEVQHPQSGLPYYWNPATGETTAVGEPRPGPEGRLQAYRQATVQPGEAAQAGRRGGAGGLLQLVGMGAGVGLVFALFSRMF